MRAEPDLSIVIPIFNRGEIIRYTFESVRRATGDLAVETIVVDDGSAVPVVDTLKALGLAATQVIRQPNRGLLFARLTGLAAASGRHVLFLDSDDLITPDKLTAQVATLDRTDADVCYTDTAQTTLTGEYDQLGIAPEPNLRSTADAAEFYIDVQPAPHSPIFRRRYLEEIVRTACFPPSPHYNAVAEIWFYHVAAPRPARVAHVPGPRAIIGRHPSVRLTNHWERLGVASLAVMEAFTRTCPSDTPQARRARALVGAKAFRSWRALPRDFPPEFGDRLLAVWRRLGARSDTVTLGGPAFQMARRVVGPIAAGRLFRRWRNASYESCRTLDDLQIAALLAGLPPP